MNPRQVAPPAKPASTSETNPAAVPYDGRNILLNNRLVENEVFPTHVYYPQNYPHPGVSQTTDMVKLRQLSPFFTTIDGTLSTVTDQMGVCNMPSSPPSSVQFFFYSTLA